MTTELEESVLAEPWILIKEIVSDEKTGNRAKLEELVSNKQLETEVEGSKVYISFSNPTIKYKVGYDSLTGNLEVELSGEMDLETCNHYFGNWIISSISSSFAGEPFSMGYGSEFRTLNLGKEIEKIKRKILNYIPKLDETSAEALAESFNLSEPDKAEFLKRLLPIFARRDKVSQEINELKKDFMEKSTPLFKVALKYYTGCLRCKPDYEADAEIVYDGNIAKVTGKYTTKQAEVLDFLFK
ncbi:hypothetical protein KY347_01520 [Candidatus Woesearchaeota archaeon]|nr:hypothetical protein [Candidatus Woesearchaeota archaeon]